jgi:hypothetical protein
MKEVQETHALELGGSGHGHGSFQEPGVDAGEKAPDFAAGLRVSCRRKPRP